MSPEEYFDRYLETLPLDHPHRSARWIADSWGDGPEMADELGRLIAVGIKSATCSALWEYEASGEPLPGEGLLTVVVDGRGLPLCLVETLEVVVRRFDEVDAAFAYAEGEGDRSLEYWRQAHQGFFTRTLERKGRVFDPSMPLVCERFHRVS
jgi:uncharacterized protein YhfF